MIHIVKLCRKCAPPWLQILMGPCCGPREIAPGEICIVCNRELGISGGWCLMSSADNMPSGQPLRRIDVIGKGNRL